MSSGVPAWSPTSVGTLSAFQAHSGGIVGRQVKFTTEQGHPVQGTLVDMGPSEMSSVYYSLTVREQSDALETYHLPLSHDIEYVPKRTELETCVICGEKVLTMTFKSTGVCGEAHRKRRDGEVEKKDKALNP